VGGALEWIVLADHAATAGNRLFGNFGQLHVNQIVPRGWRQHVRDMERLDLDAAQDVNPARTEWYRLLSC